MQTCRFNSFDDLTNSEFNLCSSRSSERPIVVNCAGVMSLDTRFATENSTGRLDYYFIYVLEGELAVTLDGIDKTAREGDIIIFPPDVPYSYRNAKNEKIVYLWAHFTGSHAERYLKECQFCGLPAMWNGDAVSIMGMKRRFERLFDIYAAGEIRRDARLCNCFEDILFFAADCIDTEITERERFCASLRYMNSHYNTDVKVSRLAQMENLSVSRYNYLFRKTVGISPKKYLVNLRLSTAKQLLAETDMSIKQISICVGYEDSCYFSRLFKEHTCQSPEQYRNDIK